jgi:hypothetical protein
MKPSPEPKLNWSAPIIHRLKRIEFATLCLLAMAQLRCGASFDPESSINATETTAWGKSEFALTADLNGVRYALRDAEFSLSGPEEVLVRSNDYPNATTLVQELQSGQYTLELLPGYRMVIVTEDGESEVSASLETPNPQTLLIAADQTTAVNILFRIDEQAVGFGQGSLSVGLTVEQAEPGGIFFSEFMVNPTSVTDTEGEWVEVMNTSGSDFDLNGCTIQRDDSSFTISTSLIVPAGGVVTLANGPSPGFTPAFQYSGVSLPNTAIFALSLTCASVTLDTLAIEPGSWPVSAGASASLAPDFSGPSSNDDGSAWCLANTSYGLDFGTPGAPNDPCEG